MPATVPIEVDVLEAQTTRLSGRLYADDQVTPLPGSLLSTLTLTVYVADADQTVLVNERNVLNVNGGTLDELGQLVVLLAPADMPVLYPTLPHERHVCLFRWSWDPGAGALRTGAAELVLVLRNLAKIPA